MKTFDSGTIDWATIDRQTVALMTVAFTKVASTTIAIGGRSKLLEEDLLAAGGIAAEVAYEGDATGCPHCICRVVADFPEADSPEAVAPEAHSPEAHSPEAIARKVWAA